MQNLPIEKDPIFVDWRRSDLGGIRVTAWTDRNATPYMDVQRLNKDGDHKGMPSWLERQRFLSYMVIGFDKDEQPVKIFMDAEVTYFGLRVSLMLPWEPPEKLFYNRILRARWDDAGLGMGTLNDSEGATYRLSQSA